MDASHTMIWLAQACAALGCLIVFLYYLRLALRQRRSPWTVALIAAALIAAGNVVTSLATAYNWELGRQLGGLGVRAVLVALAAYVLATFRRG